MRIILSTLVILPLVACAGGTAPQNTASAPPPEMRPLTQAEKVALARSLSLTLKDPDAAQFRWLPAIKQLRDGEVGYCGLVNGKNSYGGYTGYKKFFAKIEQNSKGEYVRGRIERIEGQPVTFGGTSTVQDAIDSGFVEGSCRGWGYINFNEAS